MAIGGPGKNDKGKAGGAAGKKPGGLGGKPGGMGSKSGGGMGSKPGGGLGKQSSSSAKAGGMGANKSSGFGSKPGGSSKPGGMLGGKSSSSSAAKPGGFGAKTPAKPGSSAKPGGLMGKPGASGSKPGGLGGAKPGGLGAAKPGSSAAKPGAMGAAKPGAMGAAKPGAMGAGKPGAMGAGKPGAMGAGKPGAMGAKPGSAMGAKPGALGAKAGSSGVLGAKPGTSAGKLGAGMGSKPGGLGSAGKAGGLGSAGKAGGLGAGGLGAKAAGAASVQNTVRTAVALKTAHDVTRGMAPNKNGGGGFGGRGGAGSQERDDRLLRNASQNSGGNSDSGGTSRNIALSQMDRMDITKMSPRELMLLERQYGSGWLKTLAPTQYNRIQNTVGGTALTSSTPTALSSHMDPRLLQAASGIQGTGLMGTQLSTIPQDSELPHEGPETPSSADQVKFDAAILATHPEQIGDGEQEEMFAEERIPSDPMKVKLIDTAAAEQVDGAPTPTLVLPPQASSAPPPEDLSSVPTTPGPVSPGLAPQLGTLPPQQPSQLSGIPATQMSAPAYSYESYDSSPYGENLYNQQPGYDPLQDQYHMSAPLLENGHQGGDHMFYPQPAPSRYPQTHKSYYHMQNPDKYNFTKAIQNYDRASQNDGMYCYSCIMFFGVLMIGVGIIMIIVELFDLFGRHKDMPVAIAGGGTLFLGIIVLASAMLLWRRRRTIMKKKAAHV
ncbi:hypothetical protein ACHWQZ_G000124 [Mnemiopsis leidyi]